MLRRFRSAVIALLLAAAPALADVNYETLTFINADGHTYLNYATTRSDVDGYTVFLDKADSLGDYLYINPNRYEFDDTASDANRLVFDQGSYALISQGDFINAAAPQKSAVKLDRQGIYHLRTWDGVKQANGHYGIWNDPEPYTRFASAWVFPPEFEIVSYTANRNGEWVARGNTLAFFAHDVNDLVFEISYRRQANEVFDALVNQLAANGEVDVERTADDALKVIMNNKILFPSGSAALSPQGRSLIDEVVAGLSTEGAYEVIVEGHTDDVPIRGNLKNKFPSNWELSAHRALNVVHALADSGVAPERLEARAYGPYKPRGPNDSPAERAANRRIELLIKPL